MKTDKIIEIEFVRRMSFRVIRTLFFWINNRVSMIRYIWLMTVLAVLNLPVRGESVALSSLDLTQISQGWGQAKKNLSCTGGKLLIAGEEFEDGVGTHAYSVIRIDLDGRADRFRARCGVDDGSKNPQGKGGTVAFRVIGDGRTLWKGSVMSVGDRAQHVDVDLKEIRQLLLIASDGGDGLNSDHANWVEARLEMASGLPRMVPPPQEQAIRLTPKPGPEPRINGPKIYGARPGNPFLYRVPCTGSHPMTFVANGLPVSLRLDPDSGIITGTTPAGGEYDVILTAKNNAGQTQRAFKIVAGDTLALTPPMGYNHWYAHFNRIKDAMMRQAADIMISSGMADVGYQFVNVDDCWMNAAGVSRYMTDETRVGPTRDENGNIVPNRHFPDMKGLADYIHAKGLKAGLYTSPGVSTCTGCAGSYGHEVQDAQQFARWGFDFLKYDWCSYSRVAGRDPDLDAMMTPYRLMGEELKKQKRDIVLNLCQYGMGEVWKWGRMVEGHSWRTSGDLGFELNRILDIALKNAALGPWNGPGGWNDPDYLQIGWIGAQQGQTFQPPHPCPLTPAEQYSFMSLWCLLPAPLFYSGDMTRLDDFTIGILCNPEMIEVNQDALGKAARVVRLEEEDTFLMIKELEDGSQAVGLCNRGECEFQVTATWSQLSITGRQSVRDLWRQQDLGVFTKAFSTIVPRHGVAVMKITPLQ